MNATVLELDQLGIHADTPTGMHTLVHNSSLTVQRGEAVGIVGESGSGKTLTVRAIAGILPQGLHTSGDILIDGQPMNDLSPAQFRTLRSTRMGMIFQTPRAHLNALRTIGDFLTEARIHVAGDTPVIAVRRARELLDEVGIHDPDRRMRQRPAELSGGLLQRVMIAAALAMDPEILLADEITTALDVTTQEEVMALIGDLRKQRNLSLLFITHDLALAGAVCDRVNVMQEGHIVEALQAGTMRKDAQHEYTKTLMSATLEEGTPRIAHERTTEPLLSVQGLRKVYQVRNRHGKREPLVAVDSIDYEVHRGGSLGIVGESGSGKSTSARIVCGLEHPDAGTVTVAGEDWSVPARGSRARRHRAKRVQMVFQDPYQSLNPRQTIRECFTDAVRVHRTSEPAQNIQQRVIELMKQVRLDESLLDARPRSLSGGQRQRVAIGRALAAEPEVLVLDEAVSALDVTTQVEILTLLDRIRESTGVALIMITHDLTVIRRLCEHVVVMREGRIEERGSAEEILDNPRAEYTRMLLESIPREGWIPTRQGLGRTKALPTITRSQTLPEQTELS